MIDDVFNRVLVFFYVYGLIRNFSIREFLIMELNLRCINTFLQCGCLGKFGFSLFDFFC